MSHNPCNPHSAKRSRHRRTVLRLTSSSAATVASELPRPSARMMRHAPPVAAVFLRQPTTAQFALSAPRRRSTKLWRGMINYAPPIVEYPAICWTLRSRAARDYFLVFMQLMGSSNFGFDCLRSCTLISDGAFDQGLNPPESAGEKRGDQRAQCYSQRILRLTVAGGAISRHASTKCGASSSSPTASNSIPTHPRTPTYGGRKNFFGHAVINAS